MLKDGILYQMHHLPEDNAMSFIDINKLSPSTYAKDRFTQPEMKYSQ